MASVDAPLTYRERPARGDADGLLVLHHGRGADEHDLLPLADVLDPQRRLHVVTPRAPLTLAGAPGYHWYVVPRVGYPDPDTFHAAYRQLAALPRRAVGAPRHATGANRARRLLDGLGDELRARARRRTGPSPAGILAFSGFIPTVEGWQPDLVEHTAGRRSSPTAATIRSSASSSRGPHARAARGEPDSSVDYHESDAGHTIDPATVPPAVDWLAALAIRFA